MKRIQYKKLLRKLYHQEKIKVYTYRGVNENGVLCVLGFTLKPKQEGCVSYGVKYIAEMLRFYGKSAYEMFSPINTHYANKYYNKKIF